MDPELAVLFALTFVIHLIGTLAYAVRLAGTRTGRIAVSLALFNILILVSRASNSFQAPLLAKRVEVGLARGTLSGATADFRWLLLAAALATAAGALLVPTFQRVFTQAIEQLATHRSMPRLLLQSVSREGLALFRDSLRIPARENLPRLRHVRSHLRELPGRILVLHALSVAVWTVGVFAALYAGYLVPELRVTASNLSSIINGVATILMFILVDPHLSVLTDDVAAGRMSEPQFRRCIVGFVGSRLAGTLLAQLLLVPSALVIARVARMI